MLRPAGIRGASMALDTALETLRAQLVTPLVPTTEGYERSATSGGWFRRCSAKCKDDIFFVVRRAHTMKLVLKHPLVPWPTKFVAACSLGYLVSPIQLIPTFIPVIGQLDDLFVLFLGFKFVRKTTPPNVLAECEEKARIKWYQPQT
jgi:uncharacterized membrane protein YkvA (DUF1232 family)